MRLIVLCNQNDCERSFLRGGGGKWYSSRSLQAYEDEYCSSGQEAEPVLTCHMTLACQTKFIEFCIAVVNTVIMNFGIS